MPANVSLDEFGSRLCWLKSTGGRHAVGEKSVGVLPVSGGAAADQPVEFGQPAHKHQRVAVHGDAVSREMIGQFATGEYPSGECFGDQLRGVFPGHAVDAFLFELSFPHAGLARSAEVEEPADVIGQHKMPCRAQHVGA